MRKMRKAVILLAVAMMTALLAGCGTFDASSYVKALLDNSYKNDSTVFVEQKVGTREQAEELYRLGIETELNSITSGMDISDELNKEFESVLKDIFQSVKYTVGEAAKQEDGSYEVEVAYQKMIVFAPAMESFYAASQEYVNEVAEKAANGEETPSEEANGAVYTMLKDALRESLENATYEEEETTTIRIELVDKVYTPNEDDIYDLEMRLFDIDAVTAEQ